MKVSKSLQKTLCDFRIHTHSEKDKVGTDVKQPCFVSVAFFRKVDKLVNIFSVKNGKKLSMPLFEGNVTVVEYHV